IPQQSAATGPSAPPKSNEAAPAAPAAQPQQAQQAQTSFDGQSKRPSGEKLGAAVAGPNVPLPSMSLGSASAPTMGPVDLRSPVGQEFVKGANQVLSSQQQSIAPTGAGFVARSVDRDQLGMTHVRMDRTQNGIPVFGEQQIVHF